MRERAVLVALAAAVLAAGCIQVRWSRDRRFEPIDLEADAGLEPGESTLADCLALLGAPLIVQEYRDGALVLYGWERRGSWGGSASADSDSGISPSYSFSSGNAHLDGLALWFRGDGVLERKARGKLGDYVDPLTLARAAGGT